MNTLKLKPNFVLETNSGSTQFCKIFSRNWKQIAANLGAAFAGTEPIFARKNVTEIGKSQVQFQDHNKIIPNSNSKYLKKIFLIYYSSRKLKNLQPSNNPTIL